MGREKWGEKSVEREKWSGTFLVPLFSPHFSRPEKWDEKSGGEEIGARKVGREK